MKILVICQRYWPEQFQVTDICEGLASRGHDVTVLCGLPNVGLPNSEGRILPEYQHGNNRHQEHNGIHIVRSFEIGRRTGVLWRVANYYSFWKSADNKVLSMGQFDVCLAYQLSPAMMCDAARVLKRAKGVPYLLYCCDLWPESMKAMLGSRGTAIIRHFGRICRKIYSSADRIAIESPSFEEYFTSYHKVPANKLFYLPQFSTDGGKPVFDAHESVNFYFMGNMGTVQCIPFILKSFKKALEIAPKANITLNFVGDGVAVREAKEYVKQNGLTKSVVFHGRHPFSEMQHFYAQADVCVMALDDSSLIGTTIPSKLQGYMAAGKPVIAAVRGGARFVLDESGCGVVVDPGDVDGFASAMANLAVDENKRLEYGELSRQYFESHFTKHAFLDAIENELITLVKGF